MRENYRPFFHPAIGGTRGAEYAKRKYFFFSGDPAEKSGTFRTTEKIYAIRYLPSKPLKNDSKFLNFDKLVKSQTSSVFVIPANAGIQEN